ncbi:MAG: hypothetical protein NTW08_03890, partial [Gammaproteobacteria bacterium]|nr:hypothetical protein [Gammaproteobacteria bacterium]
DPETQIFPAKNNDWAFSWHFLFMSQANPSTKMANRLNLMAVSPTLPRKEHQHAVQTSRAVEGVFERKKL